jgi:hypothetical protein
MLNSSVIQFLLGQLFDQGERGFCGFGSSITTNVLTEPAQPRCSRASTGSASPKDASYEYHGLVHRAGALFDESEFTGDENAIVDFKYSSSPKITWWFDHHLSAFLTPCRTSRILKHASATRSAQTQVLRSELHLVHQLFGACCLNAVWIRHRARRGADSLGGHCGRSALRKPEAAVEMAAPAMKLTLIIESTQDPAFIPRLIPLLTEMPLAEVLSQPFVADLLPPLLERHKEAVELIRSRAEERDGTIFFDITDHPLEGFNKFIPYYLYPTRRIRLGCRSPASAPRWPWDRTPGPRPTRQRW